MPPSLYSTPNVKRVGPAGLIGESDRHYNPGLLRHAGKLWMCYRAHAPGGDCRMAIAQVHGPAFSPVTAAQWIPLSGNRTEDGRLFLHRGEPYLAYTELITYTPNVSYTCVMKYARLALKDGQWHVLQEWQPKIGNNDGSGREKNWQFFSHGEALWCIYETAPRHVLYRIEGERPVGKVESPGPVWLWGHARGGTPPIRWGDGFLSILHSSRIIEVPDGSWRHPYTLRYHAAAYTFEAAEPFKITGISRAPLLIGSDADGFAGDPRNPKFEDPLTVFPCGLVDDPSSGGFDPKLDVLTSFGINNWQSAIARFSPDRLLLGPADGSIPFRAYFKTLNGSLPVSIIGRDGDRIIVDWVVPPRQRVFGGQPPMGYAEMKDPQEAESLSAVHLVNEITADEYRRAVG